MPIEPEFTPVSMLAAVRRQYAARRWSRMRACARPRGVHSPSTFRRPLRLPGNLLQLLLPLPFASLPGLPPSTATSSASIPSGLSTKRRPAAAARTGDLRRVQPPPPVIGGRAGLEPAERSPPPSAGKRHARPLLPPSVAPLRGPATTSPLRPDLCAICSTKRRSA